MENSLARTHARLEEEIDLLANNNKVKAGESRQHNMSPKVEMGVREQKECIIQGDAYREIGGTHAEETKDWISDNDESLHDKEHDRECLRITLSKEEKARLRKPWHQTLIIKLLGWSMDIEGRGGYSSQR